MTVRVVPRGGQAQRRRDARAAVPRAKAVVGALRAQRKTAAAVGLAQLLKTLTPPRQQLVYITLVAGVEHQRVVGKIKDVMQRQHQLDHPEIGYQVDKM